MSTGRSSQVVLTLSLLMLVVLSYVVSAQNSPADLQPHNHPSFQGNGANPKLSRAKRMYALCPPEFQKIGNDCFFISDRKESWLDSHFECKDRNSKLAEPLKFADRRLRKFLQNRDPLRGEKWIGGMYNYQQNKWKWGYNGGEMKYQAFDDTVKNTKLQFHCTAMDPSVEYKWVAKVCIEKHYFICQHRMSFVSEKNRQRVYAKWNETYPNQIANEVEVYVSTNARRRNAVMPKTSREHSSTVHGSMLDNGNSNNNNGNSNSTSYRKKPRTGANRLSQVNREIKKSAASTSSTTPLPEYLPYNAYKNLENMKQKQQEDIHPLQSHVSSVDEQQSLKQRKRHSLKLTGNVDLGTDMFKKKRQKPKKLPPQEPSPSESENNEHRHHHHHHNHRHHPNDAVLAEIPELAETVEATTPVAITESTTATRKPTTTTTTESTSTAAPAVIEESTLSELKKKLEEKAQRRERLKAKLAQLTPEERQAFLLMKQQRAEARKKGLSFAKSS